LANPADPLSSHANLAHRYTSELLLSPSSPVTFASEIWSLACTIFFVIGQRPLFGSWFPTEDVILDEHVDVLGRLPEDMWTRWIDRKKHFDEQLRRVDGEKRQLLEERLEYSIQEPRRK
jgi:hypothetical protein